MKISMWNIFYELHETGKTPMIKDGRPTITCARWIVTSYLNSDAVFVGKASDYFGSEDHSVILVHRHDMIMIRDADPEEIFNEICVIIDRYTAWEESLASFMDTEDGLQAMLDASTSIFKHAAFIYGPDGHALAIAAGYPGSLHWHWQEILDNHGITSDRIRSLKETIHLSEVFLDCYPTIRDSKMGDHQYMHCNIRANDYVAGHLVLFSFTHPFEDGLEYLVEIFIEWANRYVRKHYDRYNPTSWLSALIMRMLRNSNFSNYEFTNLLQTMGWHNSDSYQFFYLREKNVSDQPVLVNRVFLQLTDSLKSSVVMLDGTDILVLENNSCRTPFTHMNSLVDRLTRDDFICGISVPFTDILQCPLYCRQAEEEMNRAVERNEPYCLATEHREDYYQKILRSASLASAYADELLLELKRYDREHKSDFYYTMKAYVYCGMQLSETARVLNIHRNSLTYRLDRIREIIDFTAFDRLRESRDFRKMNELILSFMVLDSDLST